MGGDITNFEPFNSDSDNSGMVQTHQLTGTHKEKLAQKDSSVQNNVLFLIDYEVSSLKACFQETELCHGGTRDGGEFINGIGPQHQAIVTVVKGRHAIRKVLVKGSECNE